jgi:putative ABC transport system permease protein
MSLYNLRKITGTRGTVKMVMVKILDNTQAKAISEEIKYAMRKERGSADITVLTSDQAVAIVGDVIGTIQISVLFIAIFSIIVGGIGVMNTMYTSVLERRREIGIMKALGATNSDILNIFMIESGVIGLIGGAIGMLIGISLAKGAEIAAVQSGFKQLEAYMGMDLIVGVLLFAFLLGILSGVLPARQAANLKPAEALRYE